MSNSRSYQASRKCNIGSDIDCHRNHTLHHSFDFQNCHSILCKDQKSAKNYAIHKVFNFQVAFGVAIVTIVILDFYYLMDQFCLKLVYFYAFGVLIQGLGALLWLLDNVFCAQLDSTRKLLPSYLSPLTQLHSWWHIFVGYATYLHIIVCIWHRQTYLKRSCHIKPHLFFGYVISTQK